MSERAPDELTTRQLERLSGKRIEAKAIFAFLDGRLYRRVGPELWEAYDDPEPGETS